MPAIPAEDVTTLPDDRIVERMIAGETDLYGILIRRYNRRLYRVTRAILQDDSEAEDVVQETYVRAYEHLTQFHGKSLFSTWLTRIAIYEAWSRTKRLRKEREAHTAAASSTQCIRATHTPEQDLLAVEARILLEQAIDALPDSLRSVFVMRSLEEVSTAETAECLNLTEDAVKVRLLRARHLLRRVLFERAQAASSGAFQFLGVRCDRISASVLSRIAGLRPGSGPITCL